MDIHWLFRSTIPGYAFLIPLLFYLSHITGWEKIFSSPVIAAIIAAGFPFGFFIEWISHTILHCCGDAIHPIIGPRIRETRIVLNIQENDRIIE